MFAVVADPSSPSPSATEDDTRLASSCSYYWCYYLLAYFVQLYWPLDVRSVFITDYSHHLKKKT